MIWLMLSRLLPPEAALIKDKRRVFLLPAAQTRDKTSVNPQMMKLCQELKIRFLLIDYPA